MKGLVSLWALQAHLAARGLPGRRKSRCRTEARGEESEAEARCAGVGECLSTREASWLWLHLLGCPHIPTCPFCCKTQSVPFCPVSEQLQCKSCQTHSSCWIFPVGNKGLWGPGAPPFTSFKCFKVSEPENVEAGTQLRKCRSPYSNGTAESCGLQGSELQSFLTSRCVLGGWGGGTVSLCQNAQVKSGMKDIQPFTLFTF